jgi:hypothetical protein
MSRQFHERHFPVRPNLEQLRNQAKDLLHAIRGGDASAINELKKHHSRPVNPADVKLADAQLVLARSYGLSSWTRLVSACRMTDAIWRGDVETVCRMVTRDPRLLHEAARGLSDCNWGPPMSYAANIGQDAIIEMLRGLGATDLEHAFDRAVLQGQISTVRRLFEIGARPRPGCCMGPCETLNPDGLALLFDLGVEFADEHGDRLAPVALLLQTYSRWPEGKHRSLDLLASHGITLPNTPVMAVHRGRIDLLEAQLGRDPKLVTRTFSHEEIYPRELGCSPDHSLALHGTPLAGTTLLHLCVDFDEIEIARWLIEHGADVNAKAAIDGDGFGGHTALFGSVVSQAYRSGRQRDADFTRLLLDHGANPNVRASLRKRIRFVADDSMHEYHDVTPVSWGERFHDQAWVNKAAMRLIVERGGHG